MRQERVRRIGQGRTLWEGKDLKDRRSQGKMIPNQIDCVLGIKDGIYLQTWMSYPQYTGIIRAIMANETKGQLANCCVLLDMLHVFYLTPNARPRGIDNSGYHIVNGIPDDGITNPCLVDLG